MDEVLMNTVYSFLLITTRFSGLFVATPLFSSELVPVQVKIGLSILCSLILYPIVFAKGVIAFPEVPLAVAFHVGNEFLIGVVLGFVALLTFTIFQLAGQFVDLSIGFSMVNVIDPFLGEDAPLLGQLKNLMALMVLMSINGHHDFIRALVKSFQILPITRPILNETSIEYILRVGGNLFALGLKVALPVVATIYIVDFVFGFVARTVPQMNVFIMGFPVKILIGFALLSLSMPYLVGMMIEMISVMHQNVQQLLLLFK